MTIETNPFNLDPLAILRGEQHATLEDVCRAWAGECQGTTNSAKVSSKLGGDWIPWHGGKCPILKGIKVEVRFSDGDAHNGAAAEMWNWRHYDLGCDIIAYRIAE